MNVLIPTLILTVALFVLYIRQTRPDKTLKVVHRKDDPQLYV